MCTGHSEPAAEKSFKEQPTSTFPFKNFNNNKLLSPAKMRAKRSKKYRKLMHQYELTFGFHEPYQVLGMAKTNLLQLRSHVTRESVLTCLAL
jgi:hypothetical protein